MADSVFPLLRAPAFHADGSLAAEAGGGDDLAMIGPGTGLGPRRRVGLRCVDTLPSRATDRQGPPFRPHGWSMRWLSIASRRRTTWPSWRACSSNTITPRAGGRVAAAGLGSPHIKFRPQPRRRMG